MLSAQDHRIMTLLQEASHILLITDERIDGDTIGSTLGLFHVLTDLGKRVTVYSPKPLLRALSYLPGIDRINRDVAVVSDPSITCAIVCDSADGLVMEPLFPKLPAHVPVISFDHHSANPRYGTINVVEDRAAATADVVWRFIDRCGWKVSPAAAQCFLTGICTDTNIFSNPNTTRASINASAQLLRSGADLRTIVRENFLTLRVTSLKLWGIAFSRLFYDPVIDGMGTALTRKDIEGCAATDDDINGVNAFLHATLHGDHDVLCVYRETPAGGVKGSFRAHTRNVAELAQRLWGGGGHRLAAGFFVPNATLKEEGGIWQIVRNSDEKSSI